MMRLSGLVRAVLFAFVLLGATASPHGAARAQAIVVVANGDPVTSIDIEQRMKLLRTLHRPASRDAAIESMIEERLKVREAARFGVNVTDNEIGEEVTAYANKMKTTPQAILGEIERAGVQREHFVNFFKAELGFDVLVKALNKGVEASEVQVRAELAKAGGKSAITQYTMRQIVMTLEPTASPTAVAARAKEAEALRARFTSCESGIPYAKTLSGVAIREELTRSSTSLNAQLKEILDKTPIGHLTQPSRTTSGLEMLAICGRGAAKDDSELRKVIADRLLQVHLDQDTAARVKEMRAHAVIEKR